MNKVAINNIKNQLHIVFGNAYEENIKKIKQFQSNEKVVHKSKYFVISISSCYSRDIYKKINLCDYSHNNLYIKNYKWKIETKGYTINTGSFYRYLIFESLDENIIHIPDIRKNVWGLHSEYFEMFWIETDNSEEFNLLEHL
jgi:hypothetical protein